MNDPERLLQSGPSDLTRTLLSAVKSEEPSDRALQKTLLAVGAGAAVIGTTAVAGGAAVKAGSTSLGVVVKWIGIGATAGLVTAGAAVGLEDRPKSNPPPEPAAAVALAPAAAPEPETKPAPAPAPTVAETETPKPATAKPAPATNADLLEAEDVDPSLNAEVAALDRARRALASGDPNAALTELEKYDRNLASGRLKPEALYLEMEAAVQRGDRKRAEKKALELLVAHPKSPHAARARAVASGAK